MGYIMIIFFGLFPLLRTCVSRLLRGVFFQRCHHRQGRMMILSYNSQNKSSNMSSRKLSIQPAHVCCG